MVSVCMYRCGHMLLACISTCCNVPLMWPLEADKFSETFLGEFDTPEAIWNSEMRQLMIQKISSHISDYTPRLLSNTRAQYQVSVDALCTIL